MHSAWPFRLSILIAFLTLLLVLSGGLLTTNATFATPSASPLISPTAHRHAGTGFGAISVALLAWLAVKERRASVSRLAWAIAALFLIAALVGLATSPFPGVPQPIVVLHATLAHLLLAGTVALAVLYSPWWTGPPELVRDYGWPSMRSLAVVVPALTVIQAALGAFFRQQLLGLAPHIIGAIVVSLMILLLGAFVLNQFPTHVTLRPAARTTMVVMFVQVFLGIAAFTVRSIPSIEPDIALPVIGSHVLTGSLTLAATVAMGMLILRNVQPKA